MPHHYCLSVTVIIIMLKCGVGISQTAAQSQGFASVPPTPPPRRFGEHGAIHDTEHIKQHLGEKVDISKLELDKGAETFHYFKMHDLNLDSRLDGIELIKSITHFHDELDGNQIPVMNDTELESMVSAVLEIMDTNDDGFITYAEYRRVVQ